jgi:cytochrome c-type biogenesis protein CcmE
MGSDGIFIADKILAKHDENYMAPEVAASLAQHVDEKMQPLPDVSTECNPE